MAMKEGTNMREMIDSFLTWLVEKKNSSENTIMAYRNDLGQFWTFLSANSTAQSWAGDGSPQDGCRALFFPLPGVE
jgi:site-specific recombinase XerD